METLRIRLQSPPQRKPQPGPLRLLALSFPTLLSLPITIPLNLSSELANHLLNLRSNITNTSLHPRLLVAPLGLALACEIRGAGRSLGVGESAELDVLEEDGARVEASEGHVGVDVGEGVGVLGVGGLLLVRRVYGWGGERTYSCCSCD